eukprot:scaffold48_cov311-Pinguiococcus_pyrenoidosus.AAC.178
MPCASRPLPLSLRLRVSLSLSDILGLLLSPSAIWRIWSVCEGEGQVRAASGRRGGRFRVRVGDQGRSGAEGVHSWCAEGDRERAGGRRDGRLSAARREGGPPRRSVPRRRLQRDGVRDRWPRDCQGGPQEGRGAPDGARDARGRDHARREPRRYHRRSQLATWPRVRARRPWQAEDRLRASAAVGDVQLHLGPALHQQWPRAVQHGPGEVRSAAPQPGEGVVRGIQGRRGIDYRCSTARQWEEGGEEGEEMPPRSDLRKEEKNKSLTVTSIHVLCRVERKPRGCAYPTLLFPFAPQPLLE